MVYLKQKGGSIVHWLRKKETTNFDMLLAMSTFLLTCIAAGIVCFYIGVKATCISNTPNLDQEARCVVYTMDRVTGKKNDESISASFIYSLVPDRGDS